MKKTLIAIFSISVTAGTIYYGYSKFKEFTINKLVKSWALGLEKNSQELSKEQQARLRIELDKLFILDIQLLVALTSKIQSNASDTEKALIGKKLVEKNIFKKAELSDVKAFLEFTKYTS